MCGINVQKQKPRNIDIFGSLDLTDDMCAHCAAIVSQIQTEFDQFVFIHVLECIFNQWIVRAVFVVQHCMCHLKEGYLETPLRKMKCHIDQISGTALRCFIGIL